LGNLLPLRKPFQIKWSRTLDSATEARWISAKSLAFAALLLISFIWAAPLNPEAVTVKRADLRRVLRISGTVAAVHSYSILAPRLSGQYSGTMVITKIVKNGSSVRAGDILAEFDRQSQLKGILDRQAELDNYVQQIRKKQADQASARAADETELKGAEVDVRVALVEMRKNDVIPGFQAEINKTNLAEAEARLKQLKETFALKREAEAAELRILEIQQDRARKAADHSKDNSEKMMLRSPIDGLVVLTPISKGTSMVDPQEGDQVRSGGGLMLVVNPSAMRVQASINEVDISKVYAGQSAEIRLDAYPGLTFPGKVESTSAVGTASEYSKRIRYFSAIISIQGSNPKLLPGLTAAADLDIGSVKNVLLIPREAVLFRQDQAFAAVVNEGNSELRPVKIGQMNECEVIVESGLQEGDKIALNPKNPELPGAKR
jgi:HlyD family secretion protein